MQIFYMMWLRWKDILRKFSKNDLERMSFKVTVQRLREMSPKKLGRSSDENFYRNCFNDNKFALKKGMPDLPGLPLSADRIWQGFGRVLF